MGISLVISRQSQKPPGDFYWVSYPEYWWRLRTLAIYLLVWSKTVNWKCQDWSISFQIIWKKLLFIRTAMQSVRINYFQRVALQYIDTRVLSILPASFFFCFGLFLICSKFLLSRGKSKLNLPGNYAESLQSCLSKNWSDLLRTPK